MAGARRAARTAIIDVPEWDDPTFVVAPLPDQSWNAGAGQMVDNFLDLAHFPFTHLGTFGDPDDIEVPPLLGRARRAGVRVRLRALDQAARRLDGRRRASRSRLGARRGGTWRRSRSGCGSTTWPTTSCSRSCSSTSRSTPTTTKLYCFDLRNDILDGRSTVEDTIAFQMAVADRGQACCSSGSATKATPLDVQAEVHTRADRITLEMRRVLLDLVARRARS